MTGSKTVFRRCWRWCRRHPILTAIVVLLALAFMFAKPEDGQQRQVGSQVAGFLFFLVVILAIGWIIDRKKGYHSSLSRKPQEPNIASQPTPVIMQPFTVPPNAPTSQQPIVAAPVQVEASAFEETTRREIPNRSQPGNMTLKDILDMNPAEFEEFCGRALAGMGYQHMKRVGGAGDLGADLVGVDTHGRSTIVQCKRYKPGTRIGSPVIQTFIGMKSVHHNADRGIFMTTADYSRPSIQLAKQHDLVLIDGDDLVKIAGLVFVPKPKPSARTMRFCPNCGVEVAPGNKFCPECGQGLESQAHAAGS